MERTEKKTPADERMGQRIVKKIISVVLVSTFTDIATSLDFGRIFVGVLLLCDIRGMQRRERGRRLRRRACIFRTRLRGVFNEVFCVWPPRRSVHRFSFRPYDARHSSFGEVSLHGRG